ncbi:unnamed protein product, partial [Mycena citricolor]
GIVTWSCESVSNVCLVTRQCLCIGPGCLVPLNTCDYNNCGS